MNFDNPQNTDQPAVFVSFMIKRLVPGGTGTYRYLTFDANLAA